MYKVIACLTLVFSFCGLAFSQSTVTGALLGFDGKPMPVANVELMLPGDNTPIENVSAGKDGKYSISIDSSGLWMLRYAGLSHTSHQVALYIDKPESLEVNVRLAAYEYVDSISSPGLEGDFNNYNMGNPLLMKKQPDGTFSADIETKADSIRYEIVGIARNGHTINGTGNGRYEVDNTGDYWTIVAPKDGKVHVVFDPAKLVRSNEPAKVLFPDSDSFAAQFAGIYAGMSENRAAFATAYLDYRKSGKDLRKFRYDWSKKLKSLETKINGEKNSLLGQELLVSYLTLATMGARLDSTVAARVISDIPPSSPIWSINPELVPIALQSARVSGEQVDDYVEKVISENPSKSVRSAVLFGEFMIARAKGDTVKSERYYGELVGRYSDTPFGKLVKERLSPEIRIRIGRQVPAFSVVSLDDSSKIISNESLKGKYYLIDFWATWCGPCVGEMQYLQDAFQKFKKTGFEILSISLDQSPEDVVKFRHGKWPMPWLHAFAGWNAGIVKEFGVVGIPNPVLIDPTGKIIATGGELRGDALERTLAKFIGSPEN